jgi:hypothetical protein
MIEGTQTELPKDSDSRNTTIIVSDQSGKFQRAYCFLCGKPAGWVSKESSAFIAPEHMVVTCDDCDIHIIEKYGDLPFDKIPTSLFDAFGYKPEKKENQPCCGTTPQLSNPPVPPRAPSFT